MKKLLRILLCLFLFSSLLIGSLFVSHRFFYAEPQGKTLTVLTYNTAQMGGYKKANENKVIRYLQHQDADILCLQEVMVVKDKRYLTLSELKDALTDRYPYTYLDFKVYNSRLQFGNVVFSKYPLIDKQTVRYHSNAANISSRCDVVVGSDTLRLFINHLESNRLERMEWDEVRDKVQSATRRRKEQVRILKQAVAQSPYPVLVVGDFNDIPLSYSYLYMRLPFFAEKVYDNDLEVTKHERRLTMLRDSHLKGSCLSLGNTFVLPLRSWLRIGIRIDYIFTDARLRVLSSRVDRAAIGSDHFPLITTIELHP